METYTLLTYWHWWGLAALLIIAELLAPCVYFMAWALAAAFTGLVVHVFPDMGGMMQVGTFIVSSAVTLTLAYRYRHHKVQTRSGESHEQQQDK